MVAAMYLIETDRPTVSIADLKLVVRAGVGVWVTAEQKRASTVLRRLEALGHVQVSRGERSREERAPSKRAARPTTRAARAVPPAPAPAPVAPPVDVAALVARAAQAAALQAATMVAQQFLEAQAAPVPSLEPQAPTGDLEARVEAAVKKALSGVTFGPATGGSRTVSVEENGPLFIPEGIVSAEDTTDLDLQSESSEDASLKEAADALKRLRRTKKKK
jgi:hypothetical protein